MTNTDRQPNFTIYGTDVIEADTATGRYKWGGADNMISIFEFERGKLLEYPAIEFKDITLQPEESDPDAPYLRMYFAKKNADGAIELLSGAQVIRNYGVLVIAELALDIQQNATHIMVEGYRSTGGTITFDLSKITFEKY